MRPKVPLPPVLRTPPFPCGLLLQPGKNIMGTGNHSPLWFAGFSAKGAVLKWVHANLVTLFWSGGFSPPYLNSP